MASKYSCKTCKDTGYVTTYQRLLPFNPQSPDQVKSLFHHLKLKVPKKRGEDRETTEQKYLKRLKARYPVFGGILDVRKRTKLLSDYMWSTDAAGTIRTTFGLHPSTLRKSSRKPNLQVIPRPDDVSDLPGLVRETICATEDHVLLEADSNSLEPVLVAYDVGSARMMKVAKAGMHAYFMSGVQGNQLDWRLPFADLRTACKAVKKSDGVTYDKCKRVVNGTNYGLTPYGMADEYEETFMPHPGDREKSARQVAERYQGGYFGLWPELVEWMARKRQQAHTQRYLENHYGYRHYFYDVFTYNKERSRLAGRAIYDLGNDGKRCIAFTPQSDGSAVQSEYMLRIAALAEAEPSGVYGLLLNSLRLLIHDSLVFMIPKSEEAACAQAITDVMNGPLAELGGLRIGVEVKSGPNMREQSVIETKQTIYEEPIGCAV